MPLENHNNPYDQLEHWPPMTYRNHSTISSETNKTFRSLLETETTSKHNMELQPWVPFCDANALSAISL
jgi:hypothetical protein